MHRGTTYIEAGENRIRIADKGRNDLTMSEIVLIAEKLNTNSSIIDVICAAFYMGVETGARMTNRKRRAAK